MSIRTLSAILSDMIGQPVEFHELTESEHDGHGPAFRAMWTAGRYTRSVTYFSDPRDAAAIAEFTRNDNDIAFAGPVRFSSTLNP